MIDEQEWARQEQQRRWRESLELLGLDPGAEEAPPPAAPPVAASAAPSSPVAASTQPEAIEPDASHRGRQRRHVREEAPAPEPAEIAQEAPSEPVLDVPLAETQDAGPALSEDESQEHPGGRGRRRRRRGGRSSKAADDLTAEGPASEKESSEEAATEGPAPEAEEEETGRRKRGRSRRKKGRSKADIATNGEAADEAAEAVSVEDNADDKDDDDNLSDWDVPSWNDLIAALYRPER